MRESTLAREWSVNFLKISRAIASLPVDYSDLQCRVAGNLLFKTAPLRHYHFPLKRCASFPQCLSIQAALVIRVAATQIAGIRCIPTRRTLNLTERRFIHDKIWLPVTSTESIRGINIGRSKNPASFQITIFPKGISFCFVLRIKNLRRIQ